MSYQKYINNVYYSVCVCVRGRSRNREVGGGAREGVERGRESTWAPNTQAKEEFVDLGMWLQSCTRKYAHPRTVRQLARAPFAEPLALFTPYMIT